MTLFFKQASMILVLSFSLCPLASANDCDDFLSKFELLVGRPPILTPGADRKGGNFLVYSSRGIPQKAEWTPVTGHEIFRHYTNGPAALKSIVATNTLRAGSRPYVTGDRATAVTHEDMKGIFITTPDYNSGQVDGHSALYVDFTLPAGTKVLHIVPGILLMPGPPGLPGWMADEFVKWQKDPASVPLYLHGSLQKLEAERREPPRLQTIHIIGHSPLSNP